MLVNATFRDNTTMNGKLYHKGETIKIEESDISKFKVTNHVSVSIIPDIEKKIEKIETNKIKEA